MFQGSKFQELLNTIKGKIDAIKVIRSLDCVIEEAKSENGVTIQRIRVNIGLKDAKDLVEKIGSLYLTEADSHKAETIASLMQENVILKADNNSFKLDLNHLRESYDDLNDRHYQLRNKLRDVLD